jgi:hypothetical protein
VPISASGLRTRWADWLPVAAIVAAIVLRSWFYLTWDEAYFDSDQAIVGLMAKHLTEGRAWPLFFYGQEYMLAVEAWAMAPVFLVFGPSVFALHLTMLLFNVAAALLLWRLLVREARLSPGLAATAILPFALAPVVLSAHLIEAQGGNPEPFLWVSILWVVRRRALLLGALAAVAFLHREFTLYALPALGVAALWQRTIDDGDRQQWLAEARHWMLVFFAFIVVFLSIQALKPAADLMGPHTAGMRAPDRPQDNLTQLQNRIEWNPPAIPRRVAALPTELFPMLLGVSPLDPRVLAIGSPVRVGWPELSPLLAVFGVGWPLALVFGRSRGPKDAAIFPVYLILVGVQSALLYAATRDPSVYLLRYALLSLLVPLGVAALLLQPWRPWGVQLATVVFLALLAGTAVIDHARVVQQAYRGAKPLRFADAAARLEERGVRIGRAGYWRSYAITFLTRERVKLTSTEVLRIQEYEDLADAAEPAVLRVQEQPCGPGEPEDRVGVWFLCGP